MASFKPHGNGYQGTVYVGLKADGSRDNLYVQATTLKECKSLARKVEEDLEKRKVSHFRNTKVIDFCNDYLSRHKSNLADTTYTNYKIYVDRHFAPFFKSKKFCKVNEFDIMNYISEKLEHLSSTTVRKHVVFMRKVFGEAKYKHIFDDVKLPKNRKYVPVIPTDEQFATIIADCKMKKKELIILISGKCGLRLGEIFALDMNDINFEKKEIRVDESFARDDSNKYNLKSPKSDKGYRCVPCPDIILSKIIDYKKSPYKSRRGFLKKNTVSTKLFDGRPDNFSNNYAKSMDKLGMGDIRFHDLRHYYASWLYKNGVPDHIAAELMGHDIAVLKGIYQHIGLNDKKKYLDMVRDMQNNGDQMLATDLTTIWLLFMCVYCLHRQLFA